MTNIEILILTCCKLEYLHNLQFELVLELCIYEISNLENVYCVHGIIPCFQTMLKGFWIWVFWSKSNLGLKFWKFEFEPIPKELAKVFESVKIGIGGSFKEEEINKIGSY